MTTTEQSSIDQLIINKPYEEPENHWSYNPATKKFSRAPGRCPAGYLIAQGDSKTFDDQASSSKSLLSIAFVHV